MKAILSGFAAVLLCLGPASASGAEARAPKKWMLGTEVDAVPFLNGGFYTSAVAGYGRYRARFVMTDITTPGFATQAGFSDNRIRVKAYIVDYYFRDGFKGWWIAPGFEEWDGAVTEKGSGLRRGYFTAIFTLGGGYTFRLSDHLCINPWAAVHVPVGGDRDMAFAAKTFRLRTIPEASVKVGFNF